MHLKFLNDRHLLRHIFLLSMRKKQRLLALQCANQFYEEACIEITVDNIEKIDSYETITYFYNFLKNC